MEDGGEAATPPLGATSLPRASKDEIMACQFSSWYGTFRNMETCQEGNDSGERAPRHKNVTIKSVVIPLPPTFVEYLLSDGVRLPAGATKLSSCAPADEDNGGGWSSDEDEEENDSGSDAVEPQQFAFPQLNEEIEEAISFLGGSALPKLNWSSPKDATWVNNGTMRCQTPGDVYILLKSSDFVLHDILHTFDEVHGDETVGDAAKNDTQEKIGRHRLEERREFDFELVLRKWSNLHASQEFRCFVADHELVGVSQRNHTQHFPHLTSDYMTIRSQIKDFFLDTIRHRFASGVAPNYVFDCYVDKNGRVWLLDFNAWSVRTDSLLFTWDELLETSTENRISSDGVVSSKQYNGNQDSKDECDALIFLDNVKPEIRVVQTEMEVHHNPLASYRAPIDTVDLATDASRANSFQEFMAMCERPSGK